MVKPYQPDYLKCRRALNKAIKLCPVQEIAQALQREYHALEKHKPALKKRSGLPREKSCATLRRELDRYHSQAVRLRNADSNGWVRCFTCGKVLHWSNIENGHFIERQFTLLRWNDNNTRPQCKKCNWQLEGNHAEYERRLIENIGIGKVRLLKANRKHKKWTRFELNNLIVLCKAEIEHHKRRIGEA